MDKQSIKRKKIYEEFFQYIEEHSTEATFKKDDSKVNFTELGRLFSETKGKRFPFSDVDSRRGKYALYIKDNYPDLYEKISIGECKSFYRFHEHYSKKKFNQAKKQYLDYLVDNANSLSYLKGMLSEYRMRPLEESEVDKLIAETDDLLKLLNDYKTTSDKDSEETVTLAQIREKIVSLCNSKSQINAEYLRHMNLSDK